MKHPTPLWIVLAVLAVAGLASAGAEATVSANADTETARQQTFAIHVERASDAASTDGSIVFVLVAKSRVEQTLGLSIGRQQAEGYTIELGQERLHVKPGEPARVKILVTPTDDAERGRFAFQVIAKNESGETHATVAKFGQPPPKAEARDEPAREKPRPEAKPEPRPAPATGRAWLLIELDADTDVRSLLERLSAAGLRVRLVTPDGTA